MRFNFKSAAKVRAVFNSGLTRDEAWESLIKMFDEQTASLVEGSYHLKAIRKHSSSKDITVGDVFKYDTHAATYYICITAWNPGQFFAYDEKWAPLTGSDYDHPNAAADKKAVMELKINSHYE